jgi:hypothetical protein
LQIEGRTAFGDLSFDLLLIEIEGGLVRHDFSFPVRALGGERRDRLLEDTAGAIHP